MTDSLVDTSPRQVGSHTVGPLAYGLWRFETSDIDEATELIETALDAGMNLIDTADIYGFDGSEGSFGTVEDRLGKVLAAKPELRSRMVLATKGGITPPTPYDSSPAYLRQATEDSLRRLGVDHIDLYQVHRPDMFTHPAEVASTLTALLNENKIGAVGVSNHTVAQTRALQAHLDVPIVSTQPEYSAANLDPLRDGTFDLCMELGMASLAWSPLGGGRIPTGVDVPIPLIEVLDGLADREGASRADVAIAFVLAHPARPVAILGTQNLERIRSAEAALKVNLDRNDVYDIVEASEGVPLP